MYGWSIHSLFLEQLLSFYNSQFYVSNRDGDREAKIMFKCRNILPEICKLNANLYRRYFKHHVCYHNSNSLQILFKLNSDSEFKLGFKRYIYIFFYLALKMTSPWSHQQMFMTVVLLFNCTKIPDKTLLLTLCTTAL